MSMNSTIVAFPMGQNGIMHVLNYSPVFWLDFSLLYTEEGI